MTTPNAMTLDEVITALRSVQPRQRPTPTVSQLRRLIDDVVNCVPLERISERAELSEFYPHDLLSFAEEFGKHRARVRKGTAPKATPVAVEDTGTLFGIPTPELEAARRAHQSGKRLRGGWKHLPTSLLEEQGPLVVMPTGFEKTAAHGRDIGRSVAALAVDTVDDAEIIRFAERHFAVPTTMLDADHVILLHWMATHGLVEKLLEVGGFTLQWTNDGAQLSANGPVNTVLSRLLVEAYDLLEVARTDAIGGLTTLADLTVTDVTELRQGAAKSRWLAPGEIGRMDRLLAEVAKAPGNEQLGQILRTRRNTFVRALRANPHAIAVPCVEQLNSGHVAQILSASGLMVDEAEEKAIRAELRTRLTEMGLVNDLDREIPEGLRAFQRGRLEEFYASRQARCDGDPDWKALYEVPLAEDVLVA